MAQKASSLRLQATRNGMSLLGRLFAFVGIFGLVGPTVGGVVAWATMGARSMRSPVPFVTGAYPEGIFLALTVGILTGVATLWLGKPSWTVPVVVSVLVSTAFVAAFVGDLARPDLIEVLTRLTGVFLPPSLAAGLVCWWLGRWLLVPR
jgi:hypothetical protein